jgi:hypothetical protein
VSAWSRQQIFVAEIENIASNGMNYISTFISRAGQLARLFWSLCNRLFLHCFLVNFRRFLDGFLTI